MVKASNQPDYEQPAIHVTTQRLVPVADVGRPCELNITVIRSDAVENGAGVHAVAPSTSFMPASIVSRESEGLPPRINKESLQESRNPSMKALVQVLRVALETLPSIPSQIRDWNSI